MDTRKLRGPAVLVFLSAILAGCTSIAPPNIFDTEPTPELSPRKVVELQLAGLSNAADRRAGMSLAYRFAAPANKAMLGSFRNFIQLFSGETYGPMLDPDRTDFLSSGKRRGLAYQTVRIVDGADRVHYYVFVLERQRVGEYVNCWMTVGVEHYRARGANNPPPNPV